MEILGEKDAGPKDERARPGTGKIRQRAMRIEWRYKVSVCRTCHR